MDLVPILLLFACLLPCKNMRVNQTLSRRNLTFGCTYFGLPPEKGEKGSAVFSCSRDSSGTKLKLKSLTKWSHCRDGVSFQVLRHFKAAKINKQLVKRHTSRDSNDGHSKNVFNVAKRGFSYCVSKCGRSTGNH